VERALKLFRLIHHPSTPEGERQAAEAALSRALEALGVSRQALEDEAQRRAENERRAMLARQHQPPAPRHPPVVVWRFHFGSATFGQTSASTTTADWGGNVFWYTA